MIERSNSEAEVPRSVPPPRLSAQQRHVKYPGHSAKSAVPAGQLQLNTHTHPTYVTLHKVT